MTGLECSGTWPEAPKLQDLRSHCSSSPNIESKGILSNPHRTFEKGLLEVPPASARPLCRAVNRFLVSGSGTVVEEEVEVREGSGGLCISLSPWKGLLRRPGEFDAEK